MKNPIFVTKNTPIYCNLSADSEYISSFLVHLIKKVKIQYFLLLKTRENVP